MSNLTNDDILYVAKLSKFTLTNQQVAQFRGDLEQIISFIEKLKDIDTQDKEPTAQVTGLTNVTREDVESPEQISRQELLKNVPEIDDDNHILVKKVL